MCSLQGALFWWWVSARKRRSVKDPLAARNTPLKKQFLFKKGRDAAALRWKHNNKKWSSSLIAWLHFNIYLRLFKHNKATYEWIGAIRGDTPQFFPPSYFVFHTIDFNSMQISRGLLYILIWIRKELLLDVCNSSLVTYMRKQRKKTECIKWNKSRSGFCGAYHIFFCAYSRTEKTSRGCNCPAPPREIISLGAAAKSELIKT